MMGGVHRELFKMMGVLNRPLLMYVGYTQAQLLTWSHISRNKQEKVEVLNRRLVMKYRGKLSLGNICMSQYLKW